MNLVFSSGAVKQFKKLDIQIQKRIEKKLLFWFAHSKPLLFARTLVGYNPIHYRFRIGEYRVIGREESNTFVIVSLGHRKDIY